ncbi:MAG: flotillin domain-containing protein [Burkholderiaceae bacterium]
MNLGITILTIIVIVIAIAVLWWILSRLYQRPTTERAFVRTGFGGQRVAISGGELVIPVLHEITWMNMNTLRISLECTNENALVTGDRLRLNVESDFFVRVKPDNNSVSSAARAYGSKTSSIDAMAQLLEARFSDALRSAAAESTMEALHEGRRSFAARVRDLLQDGLAESGLQIDSVAISRLDQAPKEFFNPNNAFDAAGLTILTAEIEERRKRRNEIERDSQVAIQRKNLAAEQAMLELQREEEYARLSQERELAIRRAQQKSEVAVEAAELQRLSKVAEVSAEEAVELAKTASERSVREQRIRLEQQIKELDIERARALAVAETDSRRALEVAQQQADIDIADQSKARNAALVKAEETRAELIAAEEAVISRRELERANREKTLQLVSASRDAEARGVEVVQQALAEQTAASHRSEAQLLLARAESEVQRMKQDAAERRYEVEATGRRALNEAENVMSPEAMELRARLATIERIESVVRESAKPLERVSEIKIVHLDGLGAAAGLPASGEAMQGSVSDQVMSSALKYRVQAPLVDAMLNSIGLDNAKDLLKP